MLPAEGVKAEEAYEKDGTLPDPASTDNPEFQVRACRPGCLGFRAAPNGLQARLLGLKLDSLCWVEVWTARMPRGRFH